MAEPALELSTSLDRPLSPDARSLLHEAQRDLIGALDVALGPLRRAAEAARSGQPYSLDNAELLSSLDLIVDAAKAFKAVMLRIDPPGTPWGDLHIAADKTESAGARREAALRLARLLGWPTGDYTGHMVKLRALHEARSPEELRDEVYAQAVLAVLSEPGDQLPVTVGYRSLTTPDGRPLAAGDLACHPLWQWLQEEVAWAVEDLLLGRPYSPAVRLEAPPPEDGPLPLVQRVAGALLLPQPRRGRRPRFLSPDHLLADLGPLVRDLARRGVYPSVDAVGDLAFRRGLIGGEGGDPGRQVQRWVARFPERFPSYDDFLSSALQQTP